MRNHRIWMYLGILFLSMKLYSQNTHQVIVKFPKIPECVILGIETRSSVYPNPTSQYLMVPKRSQSRLFDVSGKQIHITIDQEGQIDMGQLSNGVYILRLIVDDRIRTIKVIKQ